MTRTIDMRCRGMVGRKFETLEGMRGAAAFAVVLYHSWGLFGGQITAGGYLAVDLFFVLSGCVLSHANDGRFALGRTTEWSFFIRRLIRLWPLHAFGIILGGTGLALQSALSPNPVLTGGQVATAAIAGLAFFPTPFHSDLFPLNVPAWSLMYEVLVSLAYAAVLRRLPDVWVAIVAGLSFAGLAALMVVSAHPATYGPLASDVPGAVLRTLASFSIGVLIIRYRMIIPVPPISSVAVVMLACLPLVAPVPAPVRVPFDLFAIIIWFPICVAMGIRVEPIGARTTAIMAKLGVASFVVYALHYPIIQVFLAVTTRIQAAGPILAVCLVIGLWWVTPSVARIDDEIRSRLLKRIAK